MATLKVMLNMDRKSATGFYPLVIRVIHERCKKLIYSPFKIRIENFDVEKQLVVSSTTGTLTQKEIVMINRYVESLKNQLMRIVYLLERQTHNDFSVNDILQKYKCNIGEPYLFPYINNEIEAKVSVNNFGAATILRATRESIKRFTNGRNITFDEITYKFICDYINHLQQRGLIKNTIHMYLRNLRLIYNKAKKEGIVIVQDSPFADIKMNVTDTVKRSLSKNIIRNIANIDLSGNVILDQARDVFMFSFYTRGMSLVDMLYLKHSDIKNGVIYYVRNKTKQNIRIAITPPLQSLIKKYDSESIYVLPYLRQDSPDVVYRQYKNAVWKINKHLKQIGALLNIEIPLTTYVARHSWATIAKNHGASIATISEGLGHTTEKTTQIYLRAFDHSVIDQLNEKVVLL